jgi:hypothetical protein
MACWTSAVHDTDATCYSYYRSEGTSIAMRMMRIMMVVEDAVVTFSKQRRTTCGASQIRTVQEPRDDRMKLMYYISRHSDLKVFLRLSHANSYAGTYISRWDDGCRRFHSRKPTSTVSPIILILCVCPVTVRIRLQITWKPSIHFSSLLSLHACLMGLWWDC